MEKKRILVVEDNDMNRQLVKVVLQKCGYHVIEATDGEEAIEAAREMRPDLILMDIQLPSISGYEVVKMLKQEAKTRDIPIVALTAKAMVGDPEKAIEAGCCTYISKPIDTRELPKIIDSLIR